MKTLNYIHIPKTGGKGFQNLLPILKNHGLSTFINTTQGFDGYDKFAYVQTHYGSDPSDKYPEIDTACIFRDPLDRLVSQFAWAMMTNHYELLFLNYADKSIISMLKMFLFIDETFANNNNLQAKFVCNPVDAGVFRANHISPLAADGGPLHIQLDEGDHISTSWMMSNSKTSIEYAKEQIDKMVIIDTIENHDRFVSKMCGWFLENYGIDIEQEFKDSLINENPTFNYSIFTDADGTTWTTAELKALLTPAEVAKVYENNTLDLEIYNYVKAKLA